MYVDRGTKVRIKRSQNGNFKDASKWPAGAGEILEDGNIGTEAGWDVYDVRLYDGRETAAHGFELALACERCGGLGRVGDAPCDPCRGTGEVD